jgi:hypothetical protein
MSEEYVNINEIYPLFEEEQENTGMGEEASDQSDIARNTTNSLSHKVESLKDVDAQVESENELDSYEKQVKIANKRLTNVKAPQTHNIQSTNIIQNSSQLTEILEGDEFIMKKASIRSKEDIAELKKSLYNAKTKNDFQKAFTKLDDVLADLEFVMEAKHSDLIIHQNCGNVLGYLSVLNYNSQFVAIKDALLKKYTEKELEKIENRIKDCMQTIWNEVKKQKVKNKQKNIKKEREKLNINKIN